MLGNTFRSDCCDEGAMESDLVLLGLVLVIALLLGPIGFFLTLGARARLKRVETLQARVSQLETEVAALYAAKGVAPREPLKSTPVEAEPAAPVPATAPSPEAPPPLAPEIVASFEPAASTSSSPEDVSNAPSESAPVPPPLAAAARKIGLEEKLGAHWAVIVGGVALALGALLLVKYSIESGFFGPGARVVAGLLVGIGLVAAGEFLRRKERPTSSALSGVPIPSVLTGAGTVAAFGALYAAHALYGFIGPGLAFLLMGGLGVVTMFASALHGPALAGLGLVAALGAPILVQSNAPNPWPVVLFVAIVCAAAYGLARLRRWLWLAIAAAIGAGVWQGLLVLAAEDLKIAFAHAALVHLVLETALALVVFALAPHFAQPAAEQQPDKIAKIAALGCAAIAVIVLAATSYGAAFGVLWIIAAALVAALLALTGLLIPAAATATAGAGLVILAALTTWGVDQRPLDDVTFFVTTWPQPQNESAFVIFALVASLGLAALCVRRLLSPAPLSFLNAALYSGAAALTPLGAVSIAYLRLANFQTSSALAAAAAGLALAMTVVTTLFLGRRAPDAPPAITLGLGASASGAFAALALGLVFILSEGSLTVALALAALGSAFVSERLDIPALRWATMGLGVAVAGRLAYDPRIVGQGLGKTIIFNGLLFGYGGPALAFGLATRLMRRSGEDAPLRVAQALTILCSALLLVFEIRHAMNGGDPFAETSGLIEQGLFSLVSLLFSVVLMELNARRADWLYRSASLAFSALAVVQAIVGLLIWQNPYFTDAPIEGGGVFNGLILGYLAPAAAALILARRTQGRTPHWRRLGAMGVAMAFLFVYVNLELRRLFQGGPQIGIDASTSESEFYAYSALWLALGILLLAYGILAHSKPARIASSVLVAATVVKVFLFDLAGLEGVLRALSFLGLGAALIGIGLVYQKFVFARPVASETEPAVPPAPM
jgi:uncharacterized membrane protein